jgi:hypothetical protein
MMLNDLGAVLYQVIDLSSVTRLDATLALY